jgi:hypothetical protein
MNSRILFRSPLQQQPRRHVDRQQQQSSGSGEFQPVPARQPGQESRTAQRGQAGSVPAQAV